MGQWSPYNEELSMKVNMCKYLFFFMILAVITTGCTNYKTDMDPPPANAELEDIFPRRIDEYEGDMRQSGTPGGLEVVYGENKMFIRMILFKTSEEASQTFKQYIAPFFNAMKNHSTGNINGKWTAAGIQDDGRKWFGWTNRNYIFIINGENDEFLNKVIENFNFISR